MPAPLSSDLHCRLVRAVEAGSSAREVARRFEVSASAAIKLVRRVRETGSAAPARVGGHRRPLLARHEALLRGRPQQPRSAQGRRRPRRGPRHRCELALPAGLLARPEPDRAGLRQVQGHCCERQPPGPRTRSGRQSQPSSTPLVPPSAETTSPTRDTRSRKRKML